MKDHGEFQKLFNTYLDKNLLDAAPQELYEPINYIMSLGGKRMRPVLLLMGCEVFGGRAEDALPAAYAIELFHNFTLMHDDIMDHAPLRRGKATVHEMFDSNRAILSGDVMMIYVYEYLRKLNAEVFVKVIETFNDTAIKVCEGQQYDINFQRQDDVTIAEYLKMIELKTAVLLACSLKCGALIAKASEDDCRSIYKFGLNMGISFQLIDDLLDAFGDSDKFGKKIGGDIEENKKTYLLLKALELAEGKEKEKLVYYLENNIPHEQKIAGIKSIFEQLGIEQHVKEKIDEFYRKADKHLAQISLPESKKEILSAYSERLLNREM